MRVFALLAGFTLALTYQLIVVMPTGSPVQAGPPATGQDSAAPQGQAAQLFQELNEDRRRAGLKALTWDERLEAAAQKHTDKMAESRQLSHDLPGEPSLRQRLAAVPLERSGENVAMDTNFGRVHEGFMESPPHRANILSRGYDAVGIAVVQEGGVYWVTEDFAQRISEMSARVAEDQVATAFAQQRIQAGSAQLQRVESSEVRNLACAMAKHDDLNTAPALSLPKARYAVVYTATDPDKLPPDFDHLRTVPDVSRYSVGVCFDHSPRYPSGVYWVVAVLFGNNK